MERPFERKSSDNEARISRKRKEASPGRDLFVEAYQDLGGVPNPIGIPPRERRLPTQSGEFKRAKNIRPTDEIEEIPAEDVEEVPNEAAAEAALEMGDGDTIPTKEVMPWASTLPNEKSRQQKRSEARRLEKQKPKDEKKAKSVFEVDDTPSQISKKTKGYYAPGSLDGIMARIDAVEEELLSLQDGHANLASNTRASEQELRRELEFLRAGLGIENKSIASPTLNKELPDLNLESDGTLSTRNEDEPEMSWGETMIDNPDAPPAAKKARTKRATTELAEADIIDVTTETPTDKAREAMRIELRRLGEETGTITDPVARQEKAIATASEIRERDAEIKTMQATLRSYENHLRDAEDRQDKVDLRKQIKMVKQRMEKQTNERDALIEEYDYLMDHPTLEDELQERLIALGEERERVKNPIRLRKIEKDIAILERMGVLAHDARTWMNPREAKNIGWAFGKPVSKENKENGTRSASRNLGIDYSYPTKQEEAMEDNPDTEITLDEADLPATYNDEEEVGPLPDSEVEKLQQEYAKYRAPKEERTPSPRVAAGGTLEEKIAAIEQMVKTKRTPSGRWLGVDEVLKFERAANALKKQRPNAGEHLDVQAAERSTNGREIIPPPLPPRKKQMRERVNVDEGILEMHQAQQKKASEQKQRNIATYEARANTYKTELRGIAEELATYGEQVEIPGEETRRLKNTARSWFKSLWRKVIDRSEITELKKRYETTLERYEEAQQQKNAVERNIPVYERATLTRGPQGFAEVPGRIEERRAEQVEFETELRHLAFTERSAQNLMDCFVLNQRIDGSMLDKEEKLQATERIEKALLKQQAGNQEYKSITQKRFNAIPIMQLDKLATAKEFSRSFEFDEEILEGVDSIQNDTERTLKSLEAKVSLGLGNTRDERDASRRRLNELKRLLGGKSIEEAAQRASFLVRAAERIALMEIEDRVLHQDLAIKYGRRIKELKDLLAPKGVSAELLADLERELKRVVQATKTR